MDAKEFFKQALEQATLVATRVPAECYADPTPCDDWQLKQLVNHIIYEMAWMPDLIDGKTIEEVGDKYEGNLVKDDLVASWRETAAAALAAVERVQPGDTVEVSSGQKLAEEYVEDVAQDLIVHAWDVAQALNITLRLSDEMAAKLQDLVDRDESATFSRLAAADDESSQNKLMACFGRPSEKWRGVVANKIDW